MTSTVKVAEYLFQRLIQLGVGAIHGVPGDYNLTLLDYVEPTNLLWVGNANELNAGYAADGYARVKGLGALITTFGVGELSAINAIAGAYAERVPVVHIVGVPSRPAQDARARVHHTFNDGDFERFANMYKHVTVAQTKLLDLRTTPKQIDWALQQCLLHSQPVYIEVPVDVVDLPVSNKGLCTAIQIPEQSLPPSDALVSVILNKIHGAKQPIIFVDGEIRSAKIVEEVKALLKLLRWPTWTTGFSKSMVDETEEYTFGINRGRYDSPETQKFIKEADLVLSFGPHYSSTNTFLYSTIPPQDKTISFFNTHVVCGLDTHRDTCGHGLISRVTELVDTSKVKKYRPLPSLSKDFLLRFDSSRKSDPITQARFWRLVGNFFKPGDIIMGETGTSGYGIRDIPLPADTTLFTPITWLSIGYMLPAAQGAALAQREAQASPASEARTAPRTILLIGDGSFQMTAQELSTIIRHNLNVVVFVVNNDGYTIERCIHGLTQSYNDIQPWRYLHAPLFFGADEKSYTATVQNEGELKGVLETEELIIGSGLRMVEVIMEREDAPEGPLVEYLQKQRYISK